jgi:hypothetical protein
MKATEKNIDKIIQSLKRKIKKEYGTFIGLDKNLKPVYKK